MASGDTFKVGIHNADVNNLLILSPQIVPSSENAGHSYGIYAHASGGVFSYGDEIAESDFTQGKTYIILARTYDHLSPSEDLAWEGTPVIDGESGKSFELTFRAVDFSSMQIAGSVICTIKWENDAYAITDLKCNDNTEELSEAATEEIIDSAYKFMANSQNGILKALDAKELEKTKDTAYIQHVSRPYFNILLDQEGYYIRSSTIYYVEPYAVSFGTPVGPVTIYVSTIPELTGMQMKKTGLEQYETDQDESRYVAFGYDLLSPMSEKTLIILPTLQPVSSELQLTPSNN